MRGSIDQNRGFFVSGINRQLMVFWLISNSLSMTERLQKEPEAKGWPDRTAEEQEALELLRTGSLPDVFTTKFSDGGIDKAPESFFVDAEVRQAFKRNLIKSVAEMRTGALISDSNVDPRLEEVAKKFGYVVKDIIDSAECSEAIQKAALAAVRYALNPGANDSPEDFMVHLGRAGLSPNDRHDYAVRFLEKNIFFGQENSIGWIPEFSKKIGLQVSSLKELAQLFPKLEELLQENPGLVLRIENGKGRELEYAMGLAGYKGMKVEKIEPLPQFKT